MKTIAGTILPAAAVASALAWPLYELSREWNQRACEGGECVYYEAIPFAEERHDDPSEIAPTDYVNARPVTEVTSNGISTLSNSYGT